MIGSGLKKFASQNGMMIDGGVAYGALKGCFVSLSEGAGYKRLCVYIGPYHRINEDVPFKDVESTYSGTALAVADFIAEQASDFNTYRVMDERHKLPGVGLTQGGSVVQINFFDHPGTMKCIQAFIDDILPQVAPMTAPQLCRKCGLNNDDSTKTVLLTGEAVVPMHAACAEKAVSAAQKRAKQEKAGVGKTFLGIIGAFIGALLGAAVWLLIGILGYVASISGLVAAFLAGKGYDLLGGKPGKIKLTVLVLCVILAVVAGTVGTEIYWLHDYYQQEVSLLAPGEVAISESEFLAESIPMLWEEPEVAAAVGKDILMGLVFAALGCFGQLRMAVGGNASKVRILKG